MEFADIVNDKNRRLGVKLAPLLVLALIWLWILILVILIGVNTSLFSTLFGWDFMAHRIF